MADYVPFILKEEQQCIQGEISGKPISVIFDSTSRLSEALAVIVHFVGEDWTLDQHLICVHMLAKSMMDEEIARELISVLSVSYGVRSECLLGAMRDRASVNNVAVTTLKVVYLSLLDIGCFSHTVNHVGENFKTPVLTEFTSGWINLFSHSPKTRL